MTDTPIPAAPSDVAGRLQLIVSELQGLPHVVETCREAAALIQSLAHDREVTLVALEDVVSAVSYTEVDCGRRSYGLKTSFGAAFQKARAALASLKGGA